MKKKDIIIIAAALVLALGLYLVSQIAGGETATTVVVTVDGKEVLRRPLAVENTYEIKQEDGSVKKVYNNEEPGSYLWNGQIQNLKEDDVISMVMRAQDENGFTYEQEVSRWTVSIKDGWIQTRDETSGGILIK